MIRVRFRHDLEDLENDFIATRRAFLFSASRAVRETARDGNRSARRSARRRSGTHGKHYFKAFTVERKAPLRYEYGPDVSMKQGGMNFEEGPGPQTSPHNNLAQSNDGLLTSLEQRLDAVARDTWRL